MSTTYIIAYTQWNDGFTWGDRPITRGTNGEGKKNAKSTGRVSVRSIGIVDDVSTIPCAHDTSGKEARTPSEKITEKPKIITIRLYLKKIHSNGTTGNRGGTTVISAQFVVLRNNGGVPTSSRSHTLLCHTLFSSAFVPVCINACYESVD